MASAIHLLAQLLRHDPAREPPRRLHRRTCATHEPSHWRSHKRHVWQRRGRCGSRPSPARKQDLRRTSVNDWQFLIEFVASARMLFFLWWVEAPRANVQSDRGHGEHGSVGVELRRNGAADAVCGVL